MSVALAVQRPGVTRVSPWGNNSGEVFVDAFWEQARTIRARTHAVSRLHAGAEALDAGKVQVLELATQVGMEVEKVERSAAEIDWLAEQCETSVGRFVEKQEEMARRDVETEQEIKGLEVEVLILNIEIGKLKKDVDKMEMEADPTRRQFVELKRALLECEAERINIEPEYRRRMETLDKIKETLRKEEKMWLALSKEQEEVGMREVSVENEKNSVLEMKRQMQASVHERRHEIQKLHKEMEAKIRLLEREEEGMRKAISRVRVALADIAKKNENRRQPLWDVRNAEQHHFERARKALDQLEQVRLEQKEEKEVQVKVREKMVSLEKLCQRKHKKQDEMSKLMHATREQHAYRQQYLVALINENDQQLLRASEDILSMQNEIQRLKDEIHLVQCRKQAYTNIANRRKKQHQTV